jgi:murein DD-endopeptidase MepM/ murein hydrolase activator NlpD
MKIKNLLLIVGVALALITLFLLFFVRNSDNSPDSSPTELQDSIKIVSPEMRFGLPVDSFQWQDGSIQQNQTLSVIFSRGGVSPSLSMQAIQACDGVFDVRKIRTGKKYFFLYSDDSSHQVKHFIYQMNKLNYLRIDWMDSVVAHHEQCEVVQDTLVSSGVVSSSLWNTMKAAGADPLLALYMADIYAWTIDFYGLQKGDSFRVAYVVNQVDSTVVGIEKIIASRFYHSGKEFYAYIFTQDSIEDYFDEHGGSLRRAFLKAPLRFSRISSGFSNSRYHPILKRRRPHHGVDYAAPTGTPVRTIGDGKVTSVAWNGGYGRRVVIKHNSTYASGYAHLSKYAKGLKAGDFVKQGDIIGYVGSSGLSTGPHLDFRVYKNGQAINPLTMESPPAVPVNKENLERYNNRMKFLSAFIEP